MRLVEGEYCPAVAHRCLDYLSLERDRCAEYAEGNRCFGEVTGMRFCIDEFEYPNVRGLKPEVAVSYLTAEAKCSEQAKRLCTANEWTLACEGPERLPYPTGRRRDEVACNYDKPYRFPDNNAYANPKTRAAEIERLDQRVASGEMSECVSAYGVHDMTGNVDEWVVNEGGSVEQRPYVSGLKGGYWGPVRNRCRPMTLDHNQWHSGYQIGFRCCSNSQDATTPASELEDEAVQAATETEEASVSG
jgi:formylglycine-generating enzyme required for sulfatase activity